MQPNDNDTLGEKTEDIPPDDIPTPPPAIISTQSSSANWVQPNKNRGWVVFIIAAFLLLVLTSTAFLLNRKDASKVENEPAKSPNVVTGEHRSLFAYMDGANDIHSANFKLDTDAPREQSALPFITAAGKISRDKDTNELHAQLPVDRSFTEVKIVELKKIIDYDNREHQADYTVSNSYEVDMAGLLAKLNIMPDSKYLTFDFEGDTLAKAACQESIKSYEKSVDDELNLLQPNYQPTTNKQETKWEIEFNSVAKRLIKPIDTVYKVCTGDEQARESEDFLNNDKLTFITTQNDSTTEFKVVLEDRTYSENTQEHNIMNATISNIKKSGDKINVETTPSVFSLNNTSAFMIAINKCKDLPFIAGGGLFGSYDYASPDGDYYSGPSLFDTGYYCTAKEAEIAGYESNTE